MRGGHITPLALEKAKGGLLPQSSELELFVLLRGSLPRKDVQIFRNSYTQGLSLTS